MGQKDLPVASGKKHAEVFTSLGWELNRSKKSHFILVRAGVIVSFPDHKEVARNLLQAELRKAGITTEDYKQAFNRFT